MQFFQKLEEKKISGKPSDKIKWKKQRNQISFFY